MVATSPWVFPMLCHSHGTRPRWPGRGGRGGASGGGLLGDFELLEVVLLGGRGGDLDGEDAVAVARRDVVFVRGAGQGQDAGERAVPELRPVLALGLVVALRADREVTGAGGDLDILLRVDPGQLRP